MYLKYLILILYIKNKIKSFRNIALVLILELYQNNNLPKSDEFTYNKTHTFLILQIIFIIFKRKKRVFILLQII